MCNLAGYNGRSKANVNVIKLLAVFGTTRGTDGFGAWIGTKLYKFGGYNNEGNAFNIMHGRKIIFDKNSTANTILLHNRAKSVGYVNKDNAHPYDYDYIDGHRLIFAHNGTIKNIEELCEKYKIKSKIGMTDSYYLGQIIYENGFDVLKEYYGFAAITVLNVNTDTLYLWKGFSQCESSTATEERPLHVFNGKNFIYYNSEEIGLVTALNTENHITSMPNNTLLAYKDGVLVGSEVYDRSEIKFKPVNYHNGYGHTSSYPSTTPKAAAQDYYKIEKCPQNAKGNNIYCWQGKYWKNGHILEGIFSVFTNGYLYKSSVAERAGFEDNAAFVDYTIKYFWKGYMIKNEETYEKLVLANHDSPTFYSAYEFAQKLHPDTVYLVKHISGYSLYFNNAYVDNRNVFPLFSDYAYKIVRCVVFATDIMDLNTVTNADIKPELSIIKRTPDNDKTALDAAAEYDENAYELALSLFDGIDSRTF